MIISIVIIIIVTWCAQTSFLTSVEKGRGITSGICWAHLMVLQLLLLPHNIILLPETAAGLQYHDWYWGCVLQCVIFILRYLVLKSLELFWAVKLGEYFFFFSSCIGWETQSEMLKWMMSDDTDSRRWQNIAVRECICWASDGGGEARTGKGTQHSGHNKQVGLGARCRLPAN